MKLEIATFTDTLKKLKPVAALNKMDGPFPKGIYIGNGSARATSQMFSVRLDIPEATCKPFIIPMQAVDLLMGLPKDYESVDIEEKNGSMIIGCGSISATFSCQYADEFAEHTVAEETGSCTVDWETFESKLNSVLYACSKEAGRAVLSGVRFFTENGALSLLATDAYRLAWQRLDCPDGFQIDCIVPREALSKLLALFDAEQLTIRTGRTGIVFEADGISFTSRLIDGVYPDVKKMIPQYENRAYVKVAEFLGVMQRVRALCSNVTLRITGSCMSVKGKSETVAYSEDVMLSNALGITADIGVSITYCIDTFSTLRSAGMEEVELGISAENTGIKPITLKEETFTGLILPVRIMG